MKCVLPYSPDGDFPTLTDEYNIVYKDKVGNQDKLIEFLSDNPDKTFNVTFTYFEVTYRDNVGLPAHLNQVNLFYRINQNIRVVLPNRTYQGSKVTEFLKEKGIPYYYKFGVSTFRELETLCLDGVQSVYLLDDLWYNLNDVRKLCDRFNVKIRYIANQVPSLTIDAPTDIRSPWFVPQVKLAMERYIDIIEFEADDWVRIYKLYEVWFIKNRWEENLRILNPGMQIDVPIQSMYLDFIIDKMNCGYKCAKGSSCRKCEQFYQMGLDFAAKNWLVKRETKEKE